MDSKTKEREYYLFAKRKDEVTTSELVFRILSLKFPLTFGEMHTEYLQTYKQKLSYQAVRKAVVALQTQGVVEHAKDGYRLSKSWLLSVRSLVDSTLARYRHAQGSALTSHEGHQIFTCDSLYDTDTLWGEIVVSLCRSLSAPKEKRFISINRHPWWVPINIGHETRFCETLKELGFNLLYVFTVDTPSSRWAAKFFKSIGVPIHVCNSRSIPPTHYYNLVGNYVIEGVLPETIENRVEKLFGHRQLPTEIEPKALTELARMPGEIRLTVQRNAAFGEGLLNSIGLGKVAKRHS